MVLKFNEHNCYQVSQSDDTHAWFIEFKSIQQIDRLIEELKDVRTKMITARQKEFDNKHQLLLNF